MRFLGLARIVLMGMAATALTGCIFFPNRQDQAVRRSPSFQEGYSDGCAAATTPSSNYREGPLRDNALYNTDSTYRAGWANGFQTCKPDQNAAGGMPGGNPIGTPVPGH
jgi:hypothetical protein